MRMGMKTKLLTVVAGIIGTVIYCAVTLEQTEKKQPGYAGDSEVMIQDSKP